MKRLFLFLVFGGLFGALLLSKAGRTWAQGILTQEDLTATFTYQGFLMMGGQPANGQYDFQFKLYDAPTAGNQVGDTVSMDQVQVNDGVFTVLLTFDASVFDGHRRWLEVAVRDPNQGSDYTVLEPRQELTATPYAIYSLHAPWSGLRGIPAGFADGVDNDTLAALPCDDGQLPKWNGSAWVCGEDSDTTYTAGTGLTLSGGAFSIAVPYRLPQGCGNGQFAAWDGSQWVCTDVNAGDITAVHAGTGLTGGGDSGDVTLSADTDYLQRRVGSACDPGYAIRAINADGTVVCEQDDDTTTFWSLTGNAGTDPSANFLGTTDNQPLEIRVNNARALRIEPADTPNLIGGYSGNSVTEGVIGAVIAGGGADSTENKVTDNYGVIGGGGQNQAGNGDNDTTNATYATVAGGHGNAATGANAAVGGGFWNIAHGDDATVAGGLSNIASGHHATVGGGESNIASGHHATVAGGLSNTASGTHAAVGGGFNNTASGQSSTVGGGYYNQATAAYATIAGGGPSDPDNHPDTTNNRVTDDYGTIGGGGQNRAGNGDNDSTNAPYATVGGGLRNTAAGPYAIVGGGSHNNASGYQAVVGGGAFNSASNIDATVSGGASNTASGRYATVPGGSSNVAEGDYSLAAGYLARADAKGCFVWGDYNQSIVTCSSKVNRTVFRSTGGFYIYTKSNLSTGVFLPANGNSWSAISDRATKDDFTPVDKEALLARLAAMPVRDYHIKGQDPSIRHVGPVAQDFYAAFGYGETDHAINMEDAVGVSFAAIQGLYAENQQLKAENAALRSRVDRLEARVEVLERSGTSQSTPMRDSLTPTTLVVVLGLTVLFVFERRKEVQR